MLADATWKDVLIALIYGLPAILAAIVALIAAVVGIQVRREVRTSSEHTLAETAESAERNARKAEKHAAEATAIVRRKLGERRTDKAIDAPPRVAGTRTDDE